MQNRSSAHKACDILLFGGTGDLSLHKLLPGLYRLHREGRLPESTRIFPMGRRPLSREEFAAMAEGPCREAVKEEFNDADWRHFNESVDYQQVDASEKKDFKKLAAVVKPDDDRILLHYLSTGPDLFAPIAENLAAVGLAGPRARIVLEKPLGHSLESAQAINESLSKVFDEQSTYRIDHYLGKETVQNLMALRFANALFEPVWRAAHIDHVQISVNETLGVGTRGPYYDHSGAMRDMLQNHLLQLLCLVAMEAPVRFDAEAVHNEKVKVLQALKPLAGPAVRDRTVRGQYVAGTLNNRQVPGYTSEENVDPDSSTETYVAVQAHVDNWRWAGVPFFLRTGKRLGVKSSEIVIQFKEVPYHLFGGMSGGPNRLLIRLQPEESISLELLAKSPGKGMMLDGVELDLNLAKAFHSSQRRWEAYERLLLDVIEGDSTLFMRRDEVESAWRWVDPIIQGWAEHYPVPHLYRAGSFGPEQARQMLQSEGRQWYEASRK